MHVIRNASATLIRLRMGKGVGEPMKILFLMVDGFDTPTSINQLIETLLCDILDAGIQVHMVSGRKGGLCLTFRKHFAIVRALPLK